MILANILDAHQRRPGAELGAILALDWSAFWAKQAALQKV